MKVEKVNFNLNTQAQQAENKPKLARTIAIGNTVPNFQGAAYTHADIRKELLKHLSPQLKLMLKFKEWMGEAQNIIITAIGTGIIAPIFIKYNALSKADEDTRTYSAWRQPVSAVLAVVTQLGATIPFNNKVKSLANQGKLNNQSYNMTPFMDEKYLKKVIKKQHPEYTKSQVAEEVAKKQKIQHDELIRDMKTKNTVMYIEDGKPAKVAMDPTRFKNIMLATIDELIEEETDEKVKSDDLKRKNRIRRSDYYRTHKEVAAKHMDELDAIFKSGDILQVRKDLAKKISALKSNKADAELIKYTEEILSMASQSKNNKVIDYMAAKVNRAKGYIRDYGAMTCHEQVVERVNRSIDGRVTDIDSTLKFFARVRDAIEDNKTLNDIEKMFTVEELVNKRLKTDKTVKFAEKVAETLKKQTKSCLDGYKQVGGIFVSLVTLFVSCPLLNWVYPRFMAAVFPNLSNGKHKKDTTNLIEQASNPMFANKKAEVK